VLVMRARGHRDSRAELTLARGSRRNHRFTITSTAHLCVLFRQGTLDARVERAKGRSCIGGLRVAADHSGDHHHGRDPRTR
jgi:hypothetical protein